MSFLRRSPDIEGRCCRSAPDSYSSCISLVDHCFIANRGGIQAVDKPDEVLNISERNIT
jgi:hypothetical protein